MIQIQEAEYTHAETEFTALSQLHVYECVCAFTLFSVLNGQYENAADSVDARLDRCHLFLLTRKGMVVRWKIRSAKIHKHTQTTTNTP